MKKPLFLVLVCLLAVAVSAFVIISYIQWKRPEPTPSGRTVTGRDATPKRDLGQPNFFVQVSNRLIDARLQRPVDQTAPVKEVILGTRVTGTSHTTGRATAQFALDAKKAAIDIIFRGTAESETVGRHGPVTIGSDGKTLITARKRVLIDADGIKSLPATANAVTHTKTTGIEAKRPIVERIAERRTDAERPRTDRMVAKNTEQTVDHNMDQEVDKQVAEANDAFQKRFRQPLEKQGLFPAELLFSTTKEAIRAQVLWAKGEQAGALSAPPEFDPAPDLGVQVHESFANNLAAAELAGKHLDEATVQAAAAKLLGSLPGQLGPDQSGEPWAITFAEEEPITIRLTDDSVQLTIRAQHLVHGKTAYPGVDLEAEYKFELGDGQFKAVRQGDVRILPPGYGGEDKRLPIHDVIICSILDYWFGDVLTKEVVRKGFTPRGKWSHIGTFQPIQVQAKDGWLVVGWKHVPGQGAEKGRN